MQDEFDAEHITALEAHAKGNEGVTTRQSKRRRVQRTETHQTQNFDGEEDNDNLFASTFVLLRLIALQWNNGGRLMSSISLDYRNATE